MIQDSIVEEIRRIREDYAQRLGCDLEAIYRDIKEKESKSNRNLVSFPPKRARRRDTLPARSS